MKARDLPSKPVSKQLVDNQAEQLVIHQMDAWRRMGWKLEQIADELNRRGLSTKTPAGTPLKWKGKEIIASGKWQAGNVASILQSRHTARILQTPASGDQTAAA